MNKTLETALASVSIGDNVCCLPSYCVGFGLRWVRPADKIIHQELRRGKVMRRKQFPIWSGVGEGDLVLAQVGAIRKVVPAVRRQKKNENKKELGANAECFQTVLFT